MQEHTRRDFLVHSAAAAGMLALGAQSLFARGRRGGQARRHDHRPLGRATASPTPQQLSRSPSS